MGWHDTEAQVDTLGKDFGEAFGDVVVETTQQRI
jgi:hypothetical protein